MIALSNTTRGKWCGTACRQAAAISPKGFNLISPSTTWPRRHPRSRVHIVTKYAPAGNGWGTARRARTGGGWSGDGVCMAISFNPLGPQSWGTTKREYLRDTHKPPAATCPCTLLGLRIWSLGTTSQTPETIAERRLRCCACRSHIEKVRTRNGGGLSGRLRPPTL
jgi:hypothetical protein